MASDSFTIDVALDELEVILKVVDESLAALQPVTRWDECARDASNYWAGVGFVACQKFIVAVIAREGMDRRVALDAGPKFVPGVSVVSVVNAAANAWKHEDEWRENAQRALDNGLPPPNSRMDQALDVLDRALTDGAWEYGFANTLCKLSGEIAFFPVVPLLTEWRDGLVKP